MILAKIFQLKAIKCSEIRYVSYGPHVSIPAYLRKLDKILLQLTGNQQTVTCRFLYYFRAN